MDNEILDRYNKDNNGNYFIDIVVDKPEDIFTEYDGVIAWNRKDLDDDFDHYLMECAEELDGHSWFIRLNMYTAPDEALEKKILFAIHNFYKYKHRNTSKTFYSMLYKTIWSALGGLGILTVLTVWSDSIEAWGKAGEVIKEGLDVAIWVTMWHAIADVLYEIHPTLHRRKYCQQASTTRIIFRYPLA